MVIALILFFIIALAAFLMLRESGSSKNGKRRTGLRGQKLATGGQVADQIKRQKLPARLAIGGVPVPIAVEDRGLLFAGSPGTGKSQAITVMLDTLERDGHRAVIADASGIFYSRYAAPGAVIFNPFDRRSVNWSPLADIAALEDAAPMARSIVPDGAGESASWNGYAQALLEAVLEHVWRAGGTTGDVLRLATWASADELRETLPPGPVSALVSEKTGTMLQNVRAIIGTHLQPFSALDPRAGRDAFSIRSFITNESGWLFVTYKQSQRDALRPLIACALDIASRAVLDLPPATGDRSTQRRTWFILDELPLLGRISSLKTLLTNGSKHGSAVIAGIQTVSQLRETYGREQAQTLLATLGTWLTLRVSDTETAEYMSKALGDEEVRRVVQSGGKSRQGSGGSKNQTQNWSEQYSTQKVVMPSELQNLPDLCGYLNIAGPLPACPVRLPIAVHREPAAPGFEPAPAQADTDTDTDTADTDLPTPADAGFTLS